MRNQDLSDSEIENLTMLCGSGNCSDLITYVKRILNNRYLGLDSCARPLDYRGDFQDDACFARGYIKLISDYTHQQSLRLESAELDSAIRNYCNKLISEINKFIGG